MLIVPTAVLELIDQTPTTQIRKGRAIRLIGYIIQKYIYEGLPFTEAVQISKAHFEGFAGTRYFEDVKLLREAGVISSNDKYYYTSTAATGQCKRWTLNTELVYTSPQLVEIEKDCPEFQGTDIVQKSVGLLSRLNLKVDKRRLSELALEAAVATVEGERILVGKQIPKGRYRLPGTSHALVEKGVLFAKAIREEKHLLLYRGKCYVEDYHEFIERKVLELQYKYLLQLGKLRDLRNRRNIICLRNTTNERLDTNLTQTKSVFLSKLYLDNSRILSIDLKNSQFLFFNKFFLQDCKYLVSSPVQVNTLFYNNNNCNNKNTLNVVYNLGAKAHPLPQAPLNVLHFLDKLVKIKSWNAYHCNRITEKNMYADFGELVKFGKFYEEAGKIITGNGQGMDKQTVKRSMFTVLFAGYRFQSPDKTAIREAFPEVVDTADAFKRWAVGEFRNLGCPDYNHRGNAFLAVFLQTLESHLFIDNILGGLLQSGFRVFSKHDSILCREQDLDKVGAFVEMQLDGYFGRGCYSLETSFAGVQ